MKRYKDLKKLLDKIESGKELNAKETRRFEKFKSDYGLNKDGTVGTLQALGEILEVSRQTLYRWRQEGMPVEPNGRYDPEKILSWRGNDIQNQHQKPLPLEANGEVSEKVKWETEFRKYRAKLAEVSFRRERGELIKRSEVEALFVDRAIEFKKALLGRSRRLGLRLANKTAQECQQILDEDSTRILYTYSRHSKITQKPKKVRRKRRAKKRV